MSRRDLRKIMPGSGRSWLGPQQAIVWHNVGVNHQVYFLPFLPTGRLGTWNEFTGLSNQSGSLEDLTSAGQHLVSRLLRLDGISTVSIGGHSMKVEKTPLYDWGEEDQNLHDKVVQVLQGEFNRDAHARGKPTHVIVLHSPEIGRRHFPHEALQRGRIHPFMDEQFDVPALAWEADNHDSRCGHIHSRHPLIALPEDADGDHYPAVQWFKRGVIDRYDELTDQGREVLLALEKVRGMLSVVISRRYRATYRFSDDTPANSSAPSTLHYQAAAVLLEIASERSWNELFNWSAK